MIRTFAAFLVVLAASHASAPFAQTSSDTRALPTLPSLSEGEKPGGLAGADPPPRTAETRGGGATFNWRDVAFDGSTLFDDAALTAVVADLMTGAATLTDLEIARTRLTRFYVDAGYVNSGALLPAQNVASGTVRFDIIEGRLREVRPLGAAIGLTFGPGGQLHPDYATDRLAIDAKDPLNVEELRRKFGQLLEDPMIARLDGRLLPGAEPGEALLELEVEPVKPFALAVSMNNEHSVSNGAFGVDADAQIRNLTGRGDFADISFTATEGRQSATVRFDLPFMAGDLRPFVEATYSRSEVVENPFDELNITNRFASFAVGARWRVRRDDVNSFALIGSLEHKRSRTRLLGLPFPAVGTDSNVNSANIIRFAQEYVRRELKQVLALRSAFSLGLPVLGATGSGDVAPGDQTSNNDFADGSFFSWLGQVQYSRRIDQNVRLVARAQAQWSNVPLLSFEKIGIGGIDTVRGYRQNAITRDIAFLGTVELPVLAANLPIPGLTGGDGIAPLTIAPFIDYGVGWNNGAGSRATEHLLGAGLTATYRPNSVITANLTYGYPFTNGPDGLGSGDLTDEAIYFNVTFYVF